MRERVGSATPAMPLRRFSPAGCFCFADACRRRLRATRSSGTRCGSASLRLPAMRGLKVINGSKGSVDMRRLQEALSAPTGKIGGRR